MIFYDDQMEEDLSNLILLYLMACKCSFENKDKFLEEFADKLEKDIQILNSQIHSYNF